MLRIYEILSHIFKGGIFWSTKIMFNINNHLQNFVFYGFYSLP